ncbi:hypothetical protein Rsub_09980 [Raphidocelis subcapitata]|uniref:Tryptophan--tRNA ligase n=1 Tax=Raphidocelis subcapitata TaxID=307507 RepID=A0A2V0PCN5_9CHLO|nr:hypothetical protein Rsub_09980 [Raphidocelis subcapitata]|eukprot:GBF97289.1 hypothetical protein Rsub_09980 [Raphidocelis subcapitata]
MIGQGTAGRLQQRGGRGGPAQQQRPGRHAAALRTRSRCGRGRRSCDAPSSLAAASTAEAGAAATAEAQKRVLSGVQPTGNYMGAIKNWVPLQDDYDTFFCVVDLHAITVQHDPKDLRAAMRNMAAAYLAAGIDPDKDGTAKMSKSAENDASRINLTDDAAAIASKIKR